MMTLARQWTDVQNLADAFALRAAARHDAAAISFEGRTVSYAELHRMSSTIAATLQQRGVQRGDLVVLLCDRSVELIAAMLGVWQAGAAFVPVDPRYPEARIHDMIADAAPRLVVVGDDVFALPESANVLTLSAALASAAEPSVLPGCSLDDLAYIIYTSGSTGKPKGAMVSHRNVLRLLTATEPWFAFGETDVWTMLHSPSFDFSVWEIWGALLTGGHLVIVPYETCRDPQAICALIERYGVTILNQTPSAFQLLMQAESARPESVRSLRHVIFGGEALHLRSLLPWIERHGDDKPALINMYGITETTVHVTYYRVRRADAERETDSIIGVPIPDLSLYILDEQMQAVREGELYVGGAGVGLGYLNRPELTAQRFVPNPFDSGTLYRTGDLARRREDGALVYLGRGDQQVKLHGFRIELGEVEAALMSAPHVEQVCVLLRQHAVAGASLVAYIVSSSFDAKALAQHAAATLPAHMRPSHFLQIERIPLTINGKVDRKALPDIVTASTSVHASDTEERVMRVWQKTLALDTRVDTTQNFFEAGGTSLLLHTLRLALEQELGTPVSILQLFQYPTIQAFASLLDLESSAPTQKAMPARPRAAFQPIGHGRKALRP